MNLQATHGLVDPTPYTVPSISDKWTSLVYAGFNISKNVKEDKKVSKYLKLSQITLAQLARFHIPFLSKP